MMFMRAEGFRTKGSWQLPTWLQLGVALAMFVLFLGCSAVRAGGEQGVDPALTEWLDTLVQEQLADAPAAGVTVLVGRAGEAMLTRHYGFADLENRVPTSEGAVYQIGSLTKQFTAVALLLLQQQGKLQLSDDITRFLPDYPTHGETITIAHLLQHTSGIPNYISAGREESRRAPGRRVNMADWRIELTAGEMLAFFQDKELEFAPGEGWNYSNAGYYLAGLIIEAVSGMSYGEFVERELFSVVGMEDSFYAGYEPLIAGRVRGYKVDDNRELVNADPMSMTVPYAAGALLSTAEDLLRWNHAIHKDRLLLTSESYAKLVTPGVLNNGQTLPMNYAMGLASLMRGGSRCLMHPGGINGFSSMLSYFPDQQLSIVVLVNTYENSSPTLADKLEAALAAKLLGRGVDEMIPR